MGLFRKKHDITDIYGVRSGKRDPLRGEDVPESGFRHSGSYHKYFRGYTEIRKVNEKGRIKVERYYVKPWIVSALPTQKYWLLRLLYAVLTAVSAVLFIVALLERVPSNFSAIVALPGYITMILLFLLAVVVVNYIVVPKKMTLWDHSSSTKCVKVFSFAVGIGQLATALATVIVLLRYRFFVSETLRCVGFMVVAAICSGVLFFIERKVPYTEIPNDTKLPAGEAHEIW